MNFHPRWLFPMLVVACIQTASALTNNLALTPPMGWNDWNSYHCGISESDVTNTANAMVVNGMKAAGYRFVNIDDGWGGTRDSNGVIQAYSIAGKFPHGIKWLADNVHSQGLKLGLYTDHGTNTCSSCVGGQTPPKQAGSFGYEYVDAFTYASWEADYLKDDSCNQPAGDIPYEDYFRMADGLMKSGRDITFSLCPNREHYEYWSPDVGNLWRTTGDIGSTFSSMNGKIDQNSKSAYLAGPGRWNDPDMLEVGNGEFATNLVAARAHFSMWCIMAAPLLAGNNIATMSTDTLAILTNAEAIAVDQDPAGEQGIRVGGTPGFGEVWSKPLGYDFTTRAVALFNRNTTIATNITCVWTNLGLQAGSATVRDLWTHQDLGTFTDSFTTNVPPEGVVLLKIVGPPLPPPGVGTNYLSDLQPLYAYTGWGTQTKDQSIGGNPIALGGTVYSKGVGTHAIGGQEYNLGGVCSRFHAVIGVDDETGNGKGSVIFQVLADGRKIYDSGIMVGGDTPKTVDLDMAGVRRLTIGVTDTGNDATGNRNSYDHSDWADAFVVVTNTTPQTPGAPTGLTASAGNAITLAWNDALAAISYNVKRSLVSGGGYTTITNVPITRFVDADVTNGTTYYYVVSAVSSLGEGSNSTGAAASPCNVPPPPTNVTTSVSNTTVVVSWNASAGATSYIVSRFTGNTPPVALATVTATNYTDTNAVVGTIYYYLVTAVNACNQSGYSLFAAAKPVLPPPVYSTCYWNNTITGFPQSWNLDANWTNTTGFPNAPGSAALVAANIASNQTIALNRNITIGALLMGDPDGSSCYTISSGGGSLVLDGGANDATLTQLAGSRGDIIAVPVSLVTNLDVVNSSTNPLVIAGDVTGLSASIHLAGGTLQIGDGTTNGSLGNVNVMNNGALVFNRSNNVAMSGTISGSGSIAQSGAGVLTLAGANSFSGDVAVEHGTLLAGSGSALGDASGITVVTNGGTLDINGQNLTGETVAVSGSGVGGNGAVVSSGGQQTKALRSVILTGDTTFGGAGPWNPSNNQNRWDIRAASNSDTNGCSLSTGGRPYKLIKTGGNQVSLVAVSVDPELGDIDIQQGLLGWETATSSMGNPASNIIVRAGATLSFFNAGTAWNKHFILYGNGVGTNLYNWSGANVVIGPVQLNGGCVFWGGGTSLLLSNVVSGTGSLIKNGSYSLLLAAVNDYSGETVVNAGNLILTGNGAIPSSAVMRIGAGAVLDASERSDGTLTLANGQTLSGNGAVNGRVVIGSGATLAPGNSIGILKFTSDLALNGGSTTIMEINKSVAPSNDVVQAAGEVAYGGTLVITNSGAVPFAAGDGFKLFNASGYSGAFTNIVPAIPGINLAWQTNGLADGILSVVSSPTPAPAFNMLELRAGRLVFSGTNGVPGWVYYVLASTNLELPLNQWQPVATNFFEWDGSFSGSNIFTPNMPLEFYLLELR